MLLDQDKRLDKVDTQLDIVESNNKKSKYLIKGMTSSWGYIRNLFTSTPVQNVSLQTIEETKMKELKLVDEWEVVNRCEGLTTTQ